MSFWLISFCERGSLYFCLSHNSWSREKDSKLPPFNRNPNVPLFFQVLFHCIQILESYFAFQWNVRWKFLTTKICTCINNVRNVIMTNEKQNKSTYLSFEIKLSNHCKIKFPASMHRKILRLNVNISLQMMTRNLHPSHIPFFSVFPHKSWTEKWSALS